MIQSFGLQCPDIKISEIIKTLKEKQSVYAFPPEMSRHSIKIPESRLLIAMKVRNSEKKELKHKQAMIELYQFIHFK